MVKVLVVDDDRLARQGLILSVKWEEFGMKVVGEAPNGTKALQFLDQNPVDLVLTDLVMPVMSGIEFMKNARARHPKVQFVVLTFHEDFETAREALRLGALDYLSKLQLEKENLDLVLGRIRDRLAGAHPSPAAGTAWAFFAVTSPPKPFLGFNAGEESDPEEVAPGLLFWQPAAEVQAHAPPGWFPVRIRGLRGESRARIDNLLRRYQADRLFYDHDVRVERIDLTLADLEQERAPAPAEADLGALRTTLASMEWMHQPDALVQVGEALRALRPPPLTLLRLLAGLESQWNRIYGPWTVQPPALPDQFAVLADVLDWLEVLRQTAYAFSPLRTHSPEAQASVLRSLRILHSEFDLPLHAAGVAQRVNMSRSHFCYCFKDIVGQSFLDALSAIRLDRAKDLLTRFDWPVYEVAARTGYADDRYFSRLFKKATGLLPTEYRKNHGQ